MRTSAAGSEELTSTRAAAPRGARGFTLLELLVVLATIALGTAGVSVAMRDSSETVLEREAQRLAVLLESARAQSRASGVPVRWQTTAAGFRFEGLPPQATMPTEWLEAGTAVVGSVTLTLGPEPLIGPQGVDLTRDNRPDRRLRVATDGLRPFAVRSREIP